MAKRNAQKCCHRCDMQDKVDELIMINNQWKKDYDAMSAKYIKLKIKLDQRKKTSGSDAHDMDIVTLNIQLNLYKEKYEQITEENKRLVQQRSYLRTQSNNSIWQMNGFNVEPYHRRNASRKTQQEIMNELCVPGIHICGTFYAPNLVRDSVASAS